MTMMLYAAAYWETTYYSDLQCAIMFTATVLVVKLLQAHDCQIINI